MAIMQECECICDLGETVPYVTFANPLTNESIHVSILAVFEIQGLQALACVVAMVEFDDTVRGSWSNDVFEDVHFRGHFPFWSYNHLEMLLLFANEDFVIAHSLHDLGLSLTAFADLLDQGITHYLAIKSGCTWFGRTFCASTFQLWLDPSVLVPAIKVWLHLTLFVRAFQRKHDYIHGYSRNRISWGEAQIQLCI